MTGIISSATTFLQAVLIVGALSMVALCLAAAIRNHFKRPTWI